MIALIASSLMSRLQRTHPFFSIAFFLCHVSASLSLIIHDGVSTDSYFCKAHKVGVSVVFSLPLGIYWLSRYVYHTPLMANIKVMIYKLLKQA